MKSISDYTCHRDPAVFALGELPYHAYFIPHATRRSAAGVREDSAFFHPLNGEWLFHYESSVYDMADFFAPDADLDGFRIAKEVGKCIRLKKVVASDVLKKASLDAGRELSSEQMKRTSAFLFNPKYSDYKFADEIMSILKRGKWIEQESFARILKRLAKEGNEAKAE